MTFEPNSQADWNRRIWSNGSEPDSVPIPITRVPGLLESWGLARPSVYSVIRWARHGRRGVKLATSCHGMKLHTTLHAVRTFVKEAGLS
jgi:hypothetical protein